MPAWSFGLQYAMVFALGASLACWRHLWMPRKLAAFAVLALVLGVLHAKGPSIVAGQASLMALAVVAVVGGAACTPVLRHAGRFGDFSYGLYIYAFPVQQLIAWRFADRLGYGASLTLAVTGLLAVLSWHLLEKRALAFKPGRPASTAPNLSATPLAG
jgi:peptidoglycan/LPS O-acetylase OafA/YrhL